MTLQYLVDSDWVIENFHKNELICQKLIELKPQGIGLSIISVAELYEGAHFAKDLLKSTKAVEEFLTEFPILGLSREICKLFGRERGRLRRLGKPLPDFDLLIAVTCLHHGLTLLSNNRKHFEMIDGLEIISLP